eukprot:scaffold1503_cov263-Prasinococcus_capsulatus_cf.AAC.4
MFPDGPRGTARRGRRGSPHAHGGKGGGCTRLHVCYRVLRGTQWLRAARVQAAAGAAYSSSCACWRGGGARVAFNVDAGADGAHTRVPSAYSPPTPSLIGTCKPRRKPISARTASTPSRPHAWQ